MFASAFKKFLTTPTLTKVLLKQNFLHQQTYALALPLRRYFSNDVTKSTQVPESLKTEQPIEAEKPVSDLENKPTVDQMINQDKDLGNFMTKIYTLSGLSFLSSLGVSAAVLTSTTLAASAWFSLMGGGLTLSIGGAYALGKIPQEKVIEKLPKGILGEKLVNPFSRKLAYSAAIVGTGLVLSPAVYLAHSVSPIIVPAAAALAMLTMSGASLYAMNKPLGEFKTWKASLYGGLFGLVGFNLFSLLLHFTIGPNPLSFAWMRMEPFLGITLFSALQAYDTHWAVKDFKEGKYDCLKHSLNFVMNIQNIFLRIVEFIVEFISNLFSNL